MNKIHGLVKSQMNSNPDIPLLLQMSLSQDNKDIENATTALMQIIEDPASIQLFMQFFENETNPNIQKNYLIYIGKILLKHWTNYSQEQQNNLIIKFYQYVNNSEDPSIIHSLANIFSIIFSISKQIDIANAVLSSNNNDFKSHWFLSSRSDLPDEFVSNNLEQLIQLAQWGLSQPNFSHFSVSAKMFLDILQITQSPEIFNPVCQYIMEMLPNEPQIIDDETKNNYWALVDELFHLKILPIDLFSQFLAVLSKSSIVSQAITWFSDILPLLPRDLLITLINLDIEVLKDMIKIDLTIPEDSFEIIYNTITETSERQLVLDLIKTLMRGDEYSQCTGLYLFIPFLEASPVRSQEEIKFIVECLQNALKSSNPTLQEIALLVINSFENGSPELVSYYPSLIELISHYISSPNVTICHLAYACIITLLTECDKEIEGLLPAVWGLLAKNMVNDEIMASFMEVISLLIKSTESLDDDIVDSVLEWLETIFNKDNPKDITIRSTALLIIAALVTNEESMCDSLVPLCQQTIAEAFTSNNENAIKNACTYLDKIALCFKDRSVPIISPFVSNIGAAIQDEQYKYLATETASIYTGYSGDKTLLEGLCQIIKHLLESDDSYDQDCGCSNVTHLAKVIPNDNPIAVTLYQLVIKILLEQTEPELLQSAIVAAKSLYKRCRNANLQQFSTLTFTFLSQLMTGQIKYLEGVPPFNNQKIDILIQDIMEFFGVFFKSNPDNVTSICNSLIAWMQQTNEDNVFSIIGALADALEFCHIDESIPIQICIFIQANAKSFKDPDLQQNVAYFLGLLCRLFPQQVGLLHEVLPSVLNWWSRALSKKSGYQELLSNIASFFLSYSLLDDSFPENLIVGALQQFPPADLLETETMCSSMISLLNKNAASQNVLTEIALAFSRLFIESQSQIEFRKISDNVKQQSLAVFKQLMSNQEINQSVLSKYDKRNKKKQQLINLISH